MKDVLKMYRAIVTLLKSETGLGVEFGTLSVHQLEDGRFRVMHGEGTEEQEHIFENPEVAALCFMNTREEGQFGFDFERNSPISNDALRELAKKNPAPESWWQDDQDTPHQP